MPLKKYQEKRAFDRTPEPPPREAATSGGDFFCVQRHDATRLHYDLRFEIGGVLVSWAVPKGPTLVPGDKRLAVHVEDHPLDYGSFEGNIPKGNYGAGSVMLWDRGAYQVAGDGLPAARQVERGDFKFRLAGVKLRGEFALVRMKARGKADEWLLLKKKDAASDPAWDPEDHAWSVLTGRTQEEIAADLPARTAPGGAPPRPLPPGAAAAPMPDTVVPMRATLCAALPSGPGWRFEIKWDGIRAICFLRDGALRIDSRRGKPCERQYPELGDLPQAVRAGAAILDGEIAVLDEQGRPNFSLIQPRIMASDPHAIANLARAHPATLFLFDLLYLDGYDLRNAAWEERRRLLREVVNPTERIRLSEDFAEGALLLEAASEQGLEGIVAKRADSPYDPRRSDAWLKCKTVTEQDFVICGWLSGERPYFGSLLLGAYRGGKLVYAGNVGSGFTEKSIAEVYRILEPLRAEEPPLKGVPRLPGEITWLRPEVVCSVKYSSWTHEHRLRAPVFLGLRPDVEPAECLLDSTPPPPEQASARPAAQLPLVAGKQDQTFVSLEGVRLKLTNLNKVFWPDDGYTKRDLINYYDAVADLLLPHLRDRPLSLKRYPNGIHGDYFFQKDSPESFPAWLRFLEITDEGKTTRFVLADNRAALIYLANLACIDHNPWMSRAGSLDHPDFVLIDLDPHECGYDKIVEAAQLVRALLERIGLEGYPKTTGGDGMHIYIPVEPRYAYEQTRQFAELLGAIVATQRPDLFTAPRAVARRLKGRVYFDFLQNGKGKTISAPYVVRAYPGAPVATPLEWREVRKGLRPSQFHIRNAPERFARKGDLFAGVLERPQTLESAMERLEKLLKG